MSIQPIVSIIYQSVMTLHDKGPLTMTPRARQKRTNTSGAMGEAQAGCSFFPLKNRLLDRAEFCCMVCVCEKVTI